MSSIPPTLPFHLAKAYGAQAPVRPLTVRPLRTDPVGRIDQARGADRVDTSRLSAGAARLVGARVDVPAFEGVSAPAASQSTGAAREAGNGALPFYHHPADRNAAATAVDLGRSLDISG